MSIVFQENLDPEVSDRSIAAGVLFREEPEEDEEDEEEEDDDDDGDGDEKDDGYSE